MANEITALEQHGINLSLLFLYPIASPKQVGGVNVVPTPSSDMPSLASLAITQPEKDSLDAGDAAWETHDLRIVVGATAGQLLAAAQSLYAEKKAAFLAAYAARLVWAGTRVNA